jgi:ABC-2 type transport system ATP-binding protein
MLRVENLTKKFENKIAVNQITFQVQKGVITGLLGPNGAGKTTTMRLITGFLEPTEGSIFYENESVQENRSNFQSKLGYLPESAPLYPEMLVIEYLRYMADIRGILREDRDRRIQTVLDLCELASNLHSPISILSKGFKQRVAIAGTLIHDPEIIILDEPTSGLDPNQISHIRNLIKNLGKSKTIILSTHILQEVEDICEHAIIINNGSIVANSKVKDLNRGNQILITAKSELPPIQKLFGENLVERAKDMENDSEFLAYLITPEDKPVEWIFNTLKKSDIVVQEIKIHQKSLESIFETLTRS